VAVLHNGGAVAQARARDTAVDTFVTPGRPVLKLSGDIKAGSVSVSAGEYAIGVVKKSGDEWGMALHPGSIAYGESADMSKLIKLDSSYSKASHTTEHMLIDISPGSGERAGSAVLTLHYGSMFLVGTLL
jgi:hypothetical protein